MATKGYWKSGAVDSPPDTSTLTSKGTDVGRPENRDPGDKAGRRVVLPAGSNEKHRY